MIVKRSFLILFIATILSSFAQENDFVIPTPKQLSFGSKIVNAPNSFDFSEIDHLEKLGWIIGKFRNIEFSNAFIVQTTLDDSLKGYNGYKISLNHKNIHIIYKDYGGLVAAMHTLLQLQEKSFTHEIEITDYANLDYRGMHLDVSRHFFKVEEIKEMLDWMSYYKLNKFHWHLTDDQGWRLEIKKYPKLQTIAAFRNKTLVGHYNDQPHQFDNKKYGGYYTQEQVKDIVQYAANRGVEVIPEIEMPGHARAAIAAYPELGCTDQNDGVAEIWGIHDQVFCPKPETFEFLQNVLTEVFALFPSDYVHIGGDECPKVQWENSSFCQELIAENKLLDEHELQSFFIKKMEKFANENGKTIIGWDEILEGGLAPNAVVMSWRGEKGGIEAATMNHKVIMTPTTYAYFDYYQSEDKNEPLAIGGYLPLEKVYNWSIFPKELPNDKKQYIWGAQANVWTEYIEDFDKLTYMVFPRIMALAENAWNPYEVKDFKAFNNKAYQHSKLLTTKGLKVADHFSQLKPNIHAGTGFYPQISFDRTSSDYVVERNTIKGWGTFSGKEKLFPGKNTFRLVDKFKNVVGKPLEIEVNDHKALVAKIWLKNKPHPKYYAFGGTTIINGLYGSTKRYGGNDWIGFDGTDLEMTLEFPKLIKPKIIKVRCFNAPGQWIYPPSRFYVNGKEIKKKNIVQKQIGKVIEFTFPVSVKRYDTKLEVVLENHGVIEKGKQGAGHKAWLFVDEISIN